MTLPFHNKLLHCYIAKLLKLKSNVTISATSFAGPDISEERLWHLPRRPADIKQFNNLTIKRGFSLIELLVVITIIAILGSFSFAAFDNARQKGRDQRRKEDLKALRTALFAYYLDAAQYVSASSGFSSDQEENWIAGLSPDYIKKLPQDPLPADTSQVTPLPTLKGEFGSSGGYLQYFGSSYHPADYYPQSATCSQSTSTAFVGQWLNNTTYRTYRSFLRFLTSSLPDDATITSASLKLYVEANATKTDFNLSIESFNWGSLDCNDYSGTSTSAGGGSTSTLATGATNRFNVSASAINKTGSTYFRLVSDREKAKTKPTLNWEEYFSYSATGLDVYYQNPPPADYQCQNKKKVYCYLPSADGKSFVLWAQLENSKDKEVLGGSEAACSQTPPSAGYNFCLEAPK